MTNCDAVWHAAELALDVAAGRPIIITTCMPGLRGGNACEIYDESSSYDVVARVHYKLHRSGSRVEFQHKKESPALEKTFNTLTRRCHECLDGKLPLPIQTPDPDERHAPQGRISRVSERLLSGAVRYSYVSAAGRFSGSQPPRP